MPSLIYSVILSVDGFVADSNGDFAWAAPDEELHQFVNDRERSVGTYLYGRRMYEVMQYWQTAVGPDDSEVGRDYAEIWRAADKVVYSATLAAPVTPRTRVVRTFDADEVRQLKASSGSDLSIGGPDVAQHALRAGLVDECHLYVVPFVVGGGNRAFRDGLFLSLELVDEHRFAGGAVHLHYRTRTAAS